MKPTDRRFARGHVEHLASKHDVAVHWLNRSKFRAEAHFDTRQIFVPRAMRSVLDYVVCLHELGHIVSPWSNQHQSPDTLQEQMAGEAAAWAWALEHATPELVNQMRVRDWLVMGSMLVSYGRSAVEEADQTRRRSER